MPTDKRAYVSSFKRANSILNRSIIRVENPELGIQIHYWGFMPRHFDNMEHKHSFFEACYVLTGYGHYLEEGIEFPLQPGTLFLSRPGIQHQIKSTEGLSLCYVAFEPDEISSAEYYVLAFQQLAKLGSPVLQEELNPTPGLLWLSLISLFHSNLPGIQYPNLVLNSMALSLILSILTAHGPALNADHFVAETYDEGHFMFRQAELFIKDNLNEPLSLERISGHLHITTRHLTRLFRKYGHQSFVHYVQELRVQKAKHLLLNTNMQIKEVAVLSGFESVHYFTRVFTTKLGVSPARFRRSQFNEGRSDSSMS
ncbi:AraC family transcriptional regulator [Paenibacillus sp. J22TS3]|uniref:AraC family transcriptional regulator n=1 Tax=Paenibacillus sp. J22TS3 TaxID=2807192 RepID=UPI001B0791D6|nr:AraC family transcriptional regulator [Paenibacillus sp. J22TS3]GIP23267.1 putative HTH-type transcriptional regulator YfiF [Paenibacillus sp. J22TS3]